MDEKEFMDKDNTYVTRFWLLCVIGIVSCLYEFLIIPLIPIRKEIDDEIEKKNNERKEKALA